MNTDSTPSGMSSADRTVSARNHAVDNTHTPEVVGAMVIATALFDVADALRSAHAPHLCGLCGKVVIGDGEEELDGHPPHQG